MASVIDKLRKKSSRDDGWTKSGNFLNKPTRGWLHPDSQLEPEAGVCYGVRYVGNMEVKTSMRTLDFETRTLVAKESISRVCEAAGFKTATKKRKNDKKLNRILGESPGMQYAGANVNLTITTESLNLMVMESGEIIADHEMPGISFASGGDPDTMDYVAYIAKDPVNARACHVLECGGGLAQDVITTIGQAFELRFKQYLQKQPKTVQLPEKFDNPLFVDSWGNDPDYYNDRPDAMAPTPNGAAAAASLPPGYTEADFTDKMSEGAYSSVKEKRGFVDNLISLEEEGAVGGMTYDNSQGETDKFSYDNKNSWSPGTAANGHPPSDGLDAFNMVPFSDSLPNGNIANASSVKTDSSPGPKPNLSPRSKTESAPYHEEWFHGKLTRHQTEELLLKDGDFLVRESTNSPGQYVLSGRLNNKIKHLLLVDPEGVVRTMDRTFDSVTHLVTFHLDNGLPIVSQDSELVLRYPVINSNC